MAGGAGPPYAEDMYSRRRPGGRRRTVLVVVLISVLGVSAIVGYAVLHRTNTSATIYGTPVSYSQIVGPVSGALGSRPGGPWTVFAALGIGSGDSPSGGGGLISGCTTLWSNSSFQIAPATPANATGGKVATWLVLSSNTAGDDLWTLVSELTTVVLASNVAEVTASCTSSFSGHGDVPGTVVDSTVVATAADAAGGSAFLSNNPGGTRAYFLLGDLWFVLFTSCDLYTSSSSSTGSEFGAAYYATNGTLELPPATVTTAC